MRSYLAESISRLPMLDYTATLFKKINFENVLLIGVQHILETNLIMFQYLFEMGLKPQNTLLLGKCYSTNKEIANKFRKNGVYVHDGSVKFDSHLSFDEQFEVEIQNFICIIQSKYKLEDYGKVLVVDDGGSFIYLMNSLKQEFSNVVAIEQTSSGYNKIKDIPLKFPVINVARSKAKLASEPLFIADVIVEKIMSKIEPLELKPSNALIIGNGSIGKEINNLLKDKFRTYMYDVQPHLSDFPITDLVNIISGFDLIIGATGNEIVKENDFKKIKNGTTLVSASSSDREFIAVHLRKLLPKVENCHADIFVKGIWLLNCGFPINFDGNKNSVPPEKIQTTRALMFSAICLALEKEYPQKIIDVESKYQRLILNKFAEINSVIPFIRVA